MDTMVFPAENPHGGRCRVEALRSSTRCCKRQGRADKERSPHPNEGHCTRSAPQVAHAKPIEKMDSAAAIARRERLTGSRWYHMRDIAKDRTSVVCQKSRPD